MHHIGDYFSFSIPMWTDKGKYVGHRVGDELWIDGMTVGRFFEDGKIFGPDGRYWGEVDANGCIRQKPGNKYLIRPRFIPKQGPRLPKLPDKIIDRRPGRLLPPRL